MSELKSRIEELMEATGWDVGVVAKKAGVSSSAVSQWLGKGSKLIKSIGNIEAAKKLEEASGFNAYWIAKGILPKKSQLRESAGANTIPASLGGDLIGHPPSLAELIRRFSNEIQGAPPDVQELVAGAFAQWAKAPHRWERLVAQLERLNIGPGSATAEPRYVVAKTNNGEDAILVQPSALQVVKEISLLPESMQADQILVEVREALEESKFRHGLHKWPFHNNRYTDKPVDADRRINKEDSQPMTTAARMELLEAPLRALPPKE